MRTMNTWKFAIAQLWSRKSRLFVQWLMIVIGLGLVSGFYALEKSANEQLMTDLGPIDQIWCAKGSPLQGLLANVYHIDNPLGNISKSEVDSVALSPLVERITRISYGDSYKGRRILGADSTWKNLYNLELTKGNWPTSEMQVVLSEALAKELNLDLHGHFTSNHGSYEMGHSHEEEHEVVGIYQTSGSVADRIILTPLESVWHVHHQQDEQITAALIETSSPMALFQLPKMINSKTTFQAVLPSIEVNRIYALFGNTQKAFFILSALFLILGALSIGITIHETIRAQQFDHTLLRIFGLSVFRLTGLVWLQTTLLLGSAWLAGMIVIKTAFTLSKEYIGLKYGFQIQFEIIDGNDLYLLCLALLLGTLIIIPSMVRIFRSTIHKNLKDA